MVADQCEIAISMKPIGGYFEWEFPPTRKQELHENAVYLNSGRHALEYILRGLKDVKCIWIPYFTCDVVLQPLKRLGISYKFYRINKNLEIDDNVSLSDGEYLLYTNYYGIKDAYVREIIAIYGSHIIIDNAQALYCEAVACHQFYSPRKFIGMPDGGLAVTNVTDISDSLPIDNSNDRCSHLLKRLELRPSEGYCDFKTNSKKIADAQLSQISPISKRIFESVDLAFIKQRRCENFAFLQEELGYANKLNVPKMENFECPLVYPFWSDNVDLKKKLIDANIFVATYWPNVFDWTIPSDVEYELANQVVCIPIDQRYGKEEMEYILEKIRYNE